MFGNLFDLIIGNFMYQIVLGGGLIVFLLLLLLLVCCNVNWEKVFYEELNSDIGDDMDLFQLSFDDEEFEVVIFSDLLVEVDIYIVYGCYDQVV